MSEREPEERNTGAGGSTGSESGPNTGAGGTTGSDEIGAASGEAGSEGREPPAAGDWDPGRVEGGGEVY
jgi:hypothetical protein